MKTQFETTEALESYWMGLWDEDIALREEFMCGGSEDEGIERYLAYMTATNKGLVEYAAKAESMRA